jgi:hypothetical protein
LIEIQYILDGLINETGATGHVEVHVSSGEDIEAETKGEGGSKGEQVPFCDRTQNAERK